MEKIVIERRIRRIEKEIARLSGEAYEAYWNKGDLACWKIEQEIKPLERQLIGLEAQL